MTHEYRRRIRRSAFPRRDIALVVRQDDSGTTTGVTNHLATIGSSWRAAHMDIGNLCCRHPATKVWPRASGLAKARSATSNIGSLSGLACGWRRFRTKRGSYFIPTGHAGELALSGRVAQVQELAASVADPRAADAYPLVTYSWMFVYSGYADQAKAMALREFAGCRLSDRGQDHGAQLGYLPLSSDVLGIGRQH